MVDLMASSATFIVCLHVQTPEVPATVDRRLRSKGSVGRPRSEVYPQDVQIDRVNL